MVEKYIQILETIQDKTTDNSWVDFRGLAWLLNDDYKLDDEEI